MLSGGNPGPHKIQGIGAGFAPAILDTVGHDEMVEVSNDDALTMARLWPRRRLAGGISSGAALWAHRGATPRKYRKDIVVIIPSFAERYLSTALFEGIG